MAALVGSVALVSSVAGASDGERLPAVLVEREACGALSSAASQGAVADSSGGTTLTIAVAVPRTALLEIDAAGEVVAAATNTGCAPRPGDDVFVRTASGDLVAGDPALLARAWVGDFRAVGVYQPQG